MGVFLFLKQFVDMLYQWQFLDYGMVLFAVGLVCFLFMKEKKFIDIKKKIIVADYVVLFLFFIISFSFIRDTSFFTVYIKVMSALFMYVLGRVYGEKVFSYGRLLALASYGIVYSNVVYRFIQFGCRFTVKAGQEGLLNEGGFYYYKTDMAFAILLSAMFIYSFSKYRWLKYFTVFPVCGYMVFYSGARMEMMVLFLEYCVIFTHMILKKKGKSGILSFKKKNIISGILFGGLLVTFIVIAVLPYDTVEVGFEKNGEITLLSKIMHARHVIWWNLLGYFNEQSFITKCFGIDLGTDWLHSGCTDRAHSSYVKQLYATGYLGCIGIVALLNETVRKIGSAVNRRYAFVTLGVWMIFMFCGLTIESLESTQMSWFPFLFAGALLSCKDRVIAGE